MTQHFACPKCEGTDWKAASVVYAEGMVSGSTSGVGAGVGGGGLGVGMGKSSGSYQTELSKKAAPPELKEKPRTTMRTANKVAIWSFLGFIAAIYLFGDMSDAAHPFLFFVFFAGLPFTFLVALVVGKAPMIDEETRQEHKKALEVYEATRVCMRCGEFYVQEQQ